MTRLSVAVFGSLDVALDGEPVARLEYDKVRALLVFLAVEAGDSHPRSSLASLLWPDLPERTARRNLTQALTKLRAALGDKTAVPPFLLVDADSLQLNPAGDVQTDAARFLALLDAAETHPHRSWRTCSRCARQLTQAIALYRGDFLAQFFLPDSAPFEAWAEAWRLKLRRRMLVSHGRLAGWAEWHGMAGQAADHVRRQVELEPLLEANQRALMRLLASSGQTSAAMAQYQQLRRMLAQDLATEPEAETAALYEQIKAGTLPLQGGARSRLEMSRLPSPPARLIGREVDMQTVIQHIQDGTVSTITLTGPPGIGKTRLALEIAFAMRFDYEDGACFVELAPLSDAGLVPSAIAQVLDIKERPGKPLAVTLMAALKKQHRLLVLDNFEHVPEGASFVADLLAACPGVQVLVTSRAPLGIQAEQPYPLAPLRLADTAADLEVVAQTASVQLFVERAQTVRPDFVLTGENAQAVVEICRRLDGLPLALELIASRARTLPPEELLKEVERGLDALARGPRDLPERQRTLRSAIRWSYDRLGVDAQRMFDHLGVFAGGFTAEAAQAVVGEAHPARASLTVLTESSLVQAQPAGEESRYTFLETLREFALEQLAESGEVDTAQRRHAGYFLRLAEQAEPELIGPDQKRWFDRLDQDHANLRAALTWSLSNAPEIGLRLAARLGLFWEVRGHLQEGRTWLNDALRVNPDAGDEFRARALMVAGRLAWRQGDLNEGRELLTESYRLWAKIESQDGLAQVLYNLGAVATRHAEYAAAQAYFENSLSIARSVQDTFNEARALAGLGEVASRTGNRESGRRFEEQALALHQARRDPRNTGGLLLNLGVTTCEQGEFETARRYSESALAAGRELGDYQLITLALLNLGNVLSAQNNAAGARVHLEEAVALHRIRHATNNMAPALGSLGEVLFKLGDLAAASAHQCEALGLRVEAGDRRGVAVSLESLAALARRSGQPERATRLLGAAEAIREAIGSPLDDPWSLAEYEPLVAGVRAALGESAFAEAWAEGRGLTMEQAVRLALEPFPGTAAAASTPAVT